MTNEPAGGGSGEPPDASVDGGRAPGSSSPLDWALAFDLGLRLGISVILGLAAGLLLDGWLGTSPLFTLIGVLLGVITAMYTIWQVAREAMRR